MPTEFFTNSLIPTLQKTKIEFTQNFYDAVWCTYACLWTCFLVPHEVWKAAIPKLWHYFSIFFTVDFIGKVNLLAHLQCLHFSHFGFNSISNTLKLFLLKPCHHLRPPNLMLLPQFPTYLALMLLSVHHSFLQFFFFLFHSLHPILNTDGSDSSLAISPIHSPLLTSEMLKTQRTLSSVLPAGDRFCLLMWIVTTNTLT